MQAIGMNTAGGEETLSLIGLQTESGRLVFSICTGALLTTLWRSGYLEGSACRAVTSASACNAVWTASATFLPSDDDPMNTCWPSQLDSPPIGFIDSTGSSVAVVIHRISRRE